jgi:hypothetical protein
VYCYNAVTGALARDAVAVPIAVPAAHVITALWWGLHTFNLVA